MSMWLERYANVLSRVVPGTFVARSTRMHKLLYGRIYERGFRPRIGLFEADEVLGWRNRPSARVVHPSFDFRVGYSTDARGRRVGCGSSGARCDVAVLGCSWTFGHGVEDDACFTSRLSDSGLVVANLGVMGYGPTQAYLQVMSTGVLDELAERAGTLLYAWNSEHLIRGWRRREWVQLNAFVSPGRSSHPVLEASGDTLTPVGLIGVEEAVWAAGDLAGIVRAMEWRILDDVVRLVAQAAAVRGVRFAVVLLPEGRLGRSAMDVQRFRTLLADRDVEVVDLDGALGGKMDTRHFFQFDGHPTPLWHAEVAAALRPVLYGHVGAAVGEGAR